MTSPALCPFSPPLPTVQIPTVAQQRLVGVVRRMLCVGTRYSASVINHRDKATSFPPPRCVRLPLSPWGEGVGG